MSSSSSNQIVALQQVYKGLLLTEADGADYEAAIQRWGVNTVLRTTIVTQPRNTNEVSQIVTWCSTQAPPVKVLVKCGGHGFQQETVEDVVLIDLSKFMHGVAVEEETRRVTVQGGALWKEANEGLCGVGGLTLGGGHGWLSGQYGLTIDNLLGCEIVLSSGQILDVDSQSHPDLFWALKGAGKNFGVVTSFIFQGHPQEEMVFIGDITYSADALLDLISAFEGLVPKLPANSGAFLEFWVVEEGIDIRVELFFNGSEAEGRKLFAPILNIGNATSKVCGMAPYPHLNEQSNHLFPHGLRQMNTGSSIISMNRDMLIGAYTFLKEEVHKLSDFRGSNLFAEFVPNFVINEIAPEHAAHSRRGKDVFDMYFSTQWRTAANDELAASLLKRFMDKIVAFELATNPDAVQQPYLNRSSVQSAPVTTSDVAKAASGQDPVIARLRGVREKYDEKGLFTKFSVLLEN